MNMLANDQLTLCSITTGSTHLSTVLVTTCSSRTRTKLITQGEKCNQFVSELHKVYLNTRMHAHTHTSTRIHTHNLLFIGDESPEVDLKVVSIHLHLLQPKLTKRSQSDTLQQCLTGVQGTAILTGKTACTHSSCLLKVGACSGTYGITDAP